MTTSTAPTAAPARVAPGPVFQLVYVSSAVTLFTPAELYYLLQKSRRRNAEDGVTGMLLYKDGNFMQALEGDEPAVRRVYARIEQDPRHKGHLVLLRGRADDRNFPDWSMGFRDLRANDLGPVPGFSEFLNTPLTGREFADDPTRAQRLLLTFKRAM